MTIILANKGDEQNIINEEKTVWIYNVLVALGVEEDVLSSIPEEDMSKHLFLLGLEVWNNVDGSIDILRKEKLVAQWKNPKLILVKEKKNSYYYEIHLNEWALPFQMKRGEENE